MTAGTEGAVHWDVTRILLIDALAAIPIGGFLTLEARAGWADAILAQLPEATAAGWYMEGVKAERECIAELAERKRAVYCKPCDGAPCSYDDELGAFADLLREQP